MRSVPRGLLRITLSTVAVLALAGAGAAYLLRERWRPDPGGPPPAVERRPPGDLVPGPDPAVRLHPDAVARFGLKTAEVQKAPPRASHF